MDVSPGWLGRFVSRLVAKHWGRKLVGLEKLVLRRCLWAAKKYGNRHGAKVTFKDTYFVSQI